MDTIDLFQGITESKFTLVLMDEEQYERKLLDMVRKVHEKSSKICYICLSRPYTDIVEMLSEKGITTDKFFFIDVLSSHYGSKKNVENCIFVEDPSKIVNIQVAIAKAIAEHNCDYLIFDTISSLLMYEQNHDIVKFTHKLITESKHQNINKVYVVMKTLDLLPNENRALIKDVGMFADRTIDMK